MTSQAFSPKLFNNSGINIGLRWLFAVYVITLCDNWIRNLVLLINNYWKQQTDNNKILILFYYWFKTVTSCSRFWTNLTNLNKSVDLITVMSEFLFLWRFFTWPRNYYNDNKSKFLCVSHFIFVAFIFKEQVFDTWHPQT